MGCVVNGPGEAREADLGIAAGRGKGHLFVKGQVVRVVPEAEMVDALVAEAEAIMAEGIDARLAAADENAEAIAAADARGAAPDPGPRRQPQRREDRHDPRDRRLNLRWTLASPLLRGLAGDLGPQPLVEHRLGALAREVDAVATRSARSSSTLIASK